MHVCVHVGVHTVKWLRLAQASCLQMMALLPEYVIIHHGQKYLVDGTALCEVCHPRCVFKVYGEVNSVRNTIEKRWPL